MFNKMIRMEIGQEIIVKASVRNMIKAIEMSSNFENGAFEINADVNGMLIRKVK